ncbi:MAG: UDP-2,3-diacylglucosamine diphosphatase LpxI [Synergistaceae bacterium]|jgi:DUF1009 family protein|nr:UDP-2,3-diacylglucosamine diphosphatase LpxI [Synergistaceae bacterium]
MTVALVAGEGFLPEEIARRMATMGAKPVVYAIRENCDSIVPHALDIVPVYKTELATTLKDMASRGIGRVMFAGLVPKTLMYRSAMLDSMARDFVASLETRDDHSLLGGIVALFERAGFEVIGYRDILGDLLAGNGLVAGRTPTGEEESDIRYGVEIARVVVPLSFGQSLIVSRRSVVAIEAMEGTDAAILRAGSLCKGGVLVKMIKKGQDSRYDIPVVGPMTLDLMSRAGLTCLAVHSSWTLLLSPDEFAKMARDKNISVVGVDY